MDSLSQIVLGAATGELAAGKRLGNKAMLWGAIGGTIPDLDVLFRFEDPIRQLAFHRGFSHSLMFAFIAAPILGYILHKLYKKSEATWRDWTLLFLLSIGTHPILDCFTLWGTSLLLPFDNTRIAWNTIFVVDPIYTVPFLILVLAAMFYPKGSTKRFRLNTAGLLVSCLYLAFTVYHKAEVNNIVEDSLAKKEITYERYMTNPSPMNNVLWYTLVEGDDAYYLGYYSFLDKEKKVDFLTLPKHKELPTVIATSPSMSTIELVSKGYYTVEQSSDTLFIRDLRFGLMNGLAEGEEPEYVFSYIVDNTDPKKPIYTVEEPRRADPKKLLGLIWERMKGI